MLCAAGHLGIYERADGGDGAGDARLVVKEARADETGGTRLHARIERDEVADLDSEQPRLLGGVRALVEAHLHRVGVALFGVGLLVHVGRAVREHEGAAHLPPRAGHDLHALALDGGPVQASQGGELEPSAGLHPTDHRPEGVDVGGEGARGVLAKSGKVGEEGALRGALGGDSHRRKLAFDEPDGVFGVAGGRGGFQQVPQEPHEVVGRDLESGHGRTGGFTRSVVITYERD